MVSAEGGKDWGLWLRAEKAGTHSEWGLSKKDSEDSNPQAPESNVGDGQPDLNPDLEGYGVSGNPSEFNAPVKEELKSNTYQNGQK